jgi:hypothetical protein
MSTEQRVYFVVRAAGRYLSRAYDYFLSQAYDHFLPRAEMPLLRECTVEIGDVRQVQIRRAVSVDDETTSIYGDRKCAR